MDGFIPRQLTFFIADDERRVGSAELLARQELQDRPLIVLGEAGSGKSDLLAHLDRQNAPVPAVQLIHTPEIVLPDGRMVLIDALDEVPSQNEGQAIVLVLAALRKLGIARFMLSCRSADWRSATASAIIKQWTGAVPVELHLDPLDKGQAQRVLADRGGIGDAKAAEVVEDYASRGLEGWLGNPQTLLMLAKVVGQGGLPKSTARLFDQYVALAWDEPRKQGTPLADASRDEVLNALGAIFAALILGGHGALSFAPAMRRVESDLPFGEIEALSGLDAIGKKTLTAWLNSRLVKALGDDRFTYQHRRIGEYLGARWLALRADTDAKRKRVLALFHSTGGIVPASLRGLYAWLAHDDRLAVEVIRGDPLALIEYGDADHLPPGQASALLRALQGLAKHNPTFRNLDRLNARSLVHPALIEEAKLILSDPSQPWYLRWTIIEQLDDFAEVTRFRPLLDELMFDGDYAIQDRAIDLLLRYSSNISWAEVIAKLRARASEDDLRLALDIAVETNLATVSDADLAALVFEYSSTAKSMVAKFWRLKREVPVQRLDGLIDALATKARANPHDADDFDFWDLHHLYFELIHRRLECEQPIEPLRLWGWLQAFDGDRRSARSETDEIGEWVKAHDDVRRAIQRHVVLEADEGGEVRMRVWRVLDDLPGGYPTPSDLVTLLDAIPAGDPRWRDLVELARHDGDEGKEVRAAAQRHVAKRPDMLAWLEGLPNRPAPAWEEQRAKRELKQRAERELRWKEHRANYGSHRDQMRAGEFGAIVSPALVYVGWAREGDKETPAHERIAEWLGDDLQAEAFAGFEAFINRTAFEPTAEQIAESHANSRRWNASAIIVAAFAERVRTGLGFADLSDERLTAGLLEIELGLLRDEPFDSLKAALSSELRERGAYEDYVRLMLEPALHQRRAHPTGLYAFMRENGDAELAMRLAAEWLVAMPDMAAEAEEEMIDRLLQAGQFATLKGLSDQRLASGKLDDRRLGNWRAIALITDFERRATEFEELPAKDRDWLWTLRARIGGGREYHKKVCLNPQLWAWIVRLFRPLWPVANRPSGVSSGNTNPWDASDYLAGLIFDIGGDVSDVSIAELAHLRDAGDDFDDLVRRAIAEQAKARAEADHLKVSIGELASVVAGGPPASVRDLQTVLMTALDTVQAKVRGSDNDEWRGFYSDPANLVPKIEEACSDYLITLLRQGDEGVTFAPEPHLADQREADIACTIGPLFLPIEAKGQWHPELWTTPDKQLAAQQATDHRASGMGIFVVYWFGKAGKSPKGPPAGSGIARPTTPGELEEALAHFSPALRSGQIRIKVLDLSRPAA